MVSNGGHGIERQVAVLIDVENVGLGSIQWLFDQISDYGRVTIKRAYGDWSSVTRAARNQMVELGIEPVHLFHVTASGKNSSDIRLVIDAVDLLYQSPIDIFVIVSSDSDFVPLVSKLRSGGKLVIGAGRGGASRALVISCDRYIYMDQNEKKVKQASSDVGQHQGEFLILRAMGAAMDGEGRVAGSKLIQTMMRLDPAFDVRSTGYSTFTKYLEASPEVKVTRRRGANDVTVELADLGSSAAQAQPAASKGQAAAEQKPSGGWWPGVDAAWARRAAKRGDPIPGPSAASDAAEVLGVAKLSSSPFKTLQRLLEASDELRARWRRDRNTIIRQ
ncbi:MAG: NYN domain-containing protein [Chloroflexota bacterium]|nr:NYN domain-containing protein [Chloroflexota bacterium]MDE2941633.1 NYN domain-containing protein [Chloroflexota bacterium]MDE3267252.1 NYN domain-containing protein [Chloroflexota bacterium]